MDTAHCPYVVKKAPCVEERPSYPPYKGANGISLQKNKNAFRRFEYNLEKINVFKNHQRSTFHSRLGRTGGSVVRNNCKARTRYYLYYPSKGGILNC